MPPASKCFSGSFFFVISAKRVIQLNYQEEKIFLVKAQAVAQFLTEDFLSFAFLFALYF